MFAKLQNSYCMENTRAVYKKIAILYYEISHCKVNSEYYQYNLLLRIIILP